MMMMLKMMPMPMEDIQMPYWAHKFKAVKHIADLLGSYPITASKLYIKQKKHMQIMAEKK